MHELLSRRSCYSSIITICLSLVSTLRTLAQWIKCSKFRFKSRRDSRFWQDGSSNNIYRVPCENLVGAHKFLTQLYERRACTHSVMEGSTGKVCQLFFFSYTTRIIIPAVRGVGKTIRQTTRFPHQCRARYTAVSQREEKQIVDGVASQKIVSTKRMTHSVVNNCDYVVFSFYFLFN